MARSILTGLNQQITSDDTLYPPLPPSHPRRLPISRIFGAVGLIWDTSSSQASTKTWVYGIEFRFTSPLPIFMSRIRPLHKVYLLLTASCHLPLPRNKARQYQELIGAREVDIESLD